MGTFRNSGLVTSSVDRLNALFRFAGSLGLFGFRAVRESFRRPFEFGEITKQIFEVGWRSTPLIIASGFAFGVVLSLQTRTSMESFGAQAMIPQAVSFGLFRDIGPIIAACLYHGDRNGGDGWESISQHKKRQPELSGISRGRNASERRAFLN